MISESFAWSELRTESRQLDVKYDYSGRPEAGERSGCD